MAKLEIERIHGMSRAQARQAAVRWAEQAGEKFDMACTYTEGTDEVADEVAFKRSGVHGTLAVTDQAFTLEAQMGFLLSAFKDKIEAEIIKNLDALIATKPALAKAATAGKKAVVKKPALKKT